MTEGLRREGQESTRRKVGGTSKVCPPFFFIFYYSTYIFLPHQQNLFPLCQIQRHAQMGMFSTQYHSFGLYFDITESFSTSSNPSSHGNTRQEVCSLSTTPSACV